MRADETRSAPDQIAEQTLRQFVAALAGKRAADLTCLLAAEIDFAGLTPGRAWQARGPAEVVDQVLLGSWFSPDDVIELADSVTTGKAADRFSLGYRLRVRNPDGVFAVHQHAFAEITAGRITWMRVLCSGYRPWIG